MLLLAPLWWEVAFFNGNFYESVKSIESNEWWLVAFSFISYLIVQIISFLLFLDAMYSVFFFRESMISPSSSLLLIPPELLRLDRSRSVLSSGSSLNSTNFILSVLSLKLQDWLTLLLKIGLSLITWSSKSQTRKEKYYEWEGSMAVSRTASSDIVNT